jgi:hypothetical protein
VSHFLRHKFEGNILSWPLSSISVSASWLSWSKKLSSVVALHHNASTSQQWTTKSWTETSVSLNKSFLLVMFEHEMSPYAHVLSAWSPTGSAVLGSSGNFSRWSLVRGSRSSPQRLCLVPSFLSLSTPCLPWGKQLPPPHTPALWCHAWVPEHMRPSDHGLNLLKLWAEINLLSFTFLFSGISSEQWKPPNSQWLTYAGK